MNPWLIVAGLLAIGGAYAAGRWDGKTINEADDLKAEVARNETRSEALAVTAGAISGLEIKTTTIRQQVEHVITEKEVYRKCEHDDATFGVLNNALRPGTDQPAGHPELPGADPTP